MPERFEVGAALAALAATCPSCPTSFTVARIVCGDDFWRNIMFVIAPFPVLALVVGGLHLALRGEGR